MFFEMVKNAYRDAVSVYFSSCVLRLLPCNYQDARTRFETQRAVLGIAASVLYQVVIWHWNVLGRLASSILLHGIDFTLCRDY